MEPKTKPRPKNRKKPVADPARDVIETIVNSEKTKRGLVRRLLWFWSISTAEAQDRGFQIAKKAKDDRD